MFTFTTFDPRPAGKEANDLILSNTIGVLGVEITVLALAGRCSLGNIDPQHSDGNTELAAIEAALTAVLPPAGATLATVRADLDSIGAMAVLNLRFQGNDLTPATERIALVAASDRFARGSWPGVQPLPTREVPWPAGTAAKARPLAAIGAAVSDFKVSLGDRVSTMERWLMTGEEPEVYRAQVEKERQGMIAALESGAIKTGTVAGDRIAVVESAHRAATSIGYCLAPVVAALNPEFRFQGGEPHCKFTVCQFEVGYVDLKKALNELQALEPGWGGSLIIIGSPQGVSSSLTTEQVAEVLERHLT